jgi:hypothetical protein
MAWLSLFGLLTLAVWPDVIRQLEILINFPRPLRIDYILLVWAAVPWLWAHPRWFEPRTWAAQARENRDIVGGAVGGWWRSPGRVTALRDAGVQQGRAFFDLAVEPEPSEGDPSTATAPPAEAEGTG